MRFHSKTCYSHILSTLHQHSLKLFTHPLSYNFYNQSILFFTLHWTLHTVKHFNWDFCEHTRITKIAINCKIISFIEIFNSELTEFTHMHELYINMHAFPIYILTKKLYSISKGLSRRNKDIKIYLLQKALQQWSIWMKKKYWGKREDERRKINEIKKPFSNKI
jgi:hypothetical protein